MYKLVLSYDIQNEAGESIIKEHIPNTVSYPLSEMDANDFSSSIAKDRLAIFLTHFLASGFLEGNSILRRRGIFQEVRECNYKLSLPLEHLEFDFHHSSTKVCSNIGHDSQQVFPYESVVKAFQDDLFLDDNQNF